jgi:hypothetical protein
LGEGEGEGEYLGSQLADDQADRLVRAMVHAAEADDRLRADSKPAAHKLRLLPKVIAAAGRADVGEALLDAKFVEATAAWLEPSDADGALPAFEVRRALFDLLLKMPVAVEHLRGYTMGRLAAFYAKYPPETAEVRRMANECVSFATLGLLAL